MFKDIFKQGTQAMFSWSVGPVKSGFPETETALEMYSSHMIPWNESKYGLLL